MKVCGLSRVRVSVSRRKGDSIRDGAVMGGGAARNRPENVQKCGLTGRAIARKVPLLLGAIAQLGERLHGMQEVGGSIPPGSTNKTST